MSYNNFIPTVWAKNIERDLERKLVFAEDCNRKYEVDVKKMGDTVRILCKGESPWHLSSAAFLQFPPRGHNWRTGDSCTQIPA